MPFIAALGIALAATPLAGFLGRRFGLVDCPGELKIHRTSTPLSGGIGVAAAVFAVAPFAAGDSIAPLLIGAAISLVVGTIDDARPLSPGIRLVAQTVSGGVVALAIPLSPPEIVFVFGVVLLVAAAANAVNLIDGQDGLAGGLGAIAAGGLAILAQPNSPIAALLLALAGALAGFVMWNKAPARIFLGSGGAYFVGTLLAAGAAAAVADSGWSGLPAAALCLGVFAFELVFTVVRRIRGSAGVTIGDRLHSYDLLARAHERGVVTAWLWTIGAATAMLGVVVARLPLALGALVAAAVAAAAAWGGWRLWSSYDPQVGAAGLTGDVDTNARVNDDS